MTASYETKDYFSKLEKFLEPLPISSEDDLYKILHFGINSGKNDDVSLNINVNIPFSNLNSL
jgi:hypothetical protein